MRVCADFSRRKRRQACRKERVVLDFYSVAANALWVLGLALILAALSWANGISAREQASIRGALGRSGVQRALNGELVLLCAGLAATGRTWWEQVLWGALAAWFIVLTIWGGAGAPLEKQTLHFPQPGGEFYRAGGEDRCGRGGP